MKTIIDKMNNLFLIKNIHNLPSKYFDNHLTVINYLNEVHNFNYQTHLYNFLTKYYESEGITKTDNELYDFINKIIIHIAVTTFLQIDLQMRYSDLLLFKPRGITNDADMHMLISNINKFEGQSTWTEILQFDENLALQIIDWIEDLNIDLQTKNFLDLNNISVRNSIASIRSAIPSTIDPHIPFDSSLYKDKPLPPIPVMTQEQRINLEIMNRELEIFIQETYKKVKFPKSRLSRITELSEDVSSRSSTTSNYSSANNSTNSKYSNDDWDVWSFIPIFLINIDLIDLTIKDYNIWCYNYDNYLLSINKPLPILPVNKDLPYITSIQVNSPAEPCSNYLLTLGDNLTLLMPNTHSLGALLFLTLILCLFLLPFYLLIVENISAKQERITLGYLELKRILLNYSLILFKLIRNILRGMLYRWILSLILLILIYLFNLQDYIPTVVTAKLTANLFNATEYFSNFTEWLVLTIGATTLVPNAISLTFEVEGLVYLLELCWNKALLILNLQLENYPSKYNPFPCSNYSIALEEVSATQTPIDVVVSRSSANYLTIALCLGISILTIGVIYYLALNTNISDLEAKLETLGSDMYHGANTIQLLEDKVQVVLTNQQSILDGKLLTLTTPQDISRMISVDRETNSINEVLFENRITRVDLPSVSQEIKELAPVSLIDELM